MMPNEQTTDALLTRRRDVVRSTPDEHLLLAVPWKGQVERAKLCHFSQLGRRFRCRNTSAWVATAWELDTLVQALETAVVALVEAPRLGHGDPHEVLGKRRVRRVPFTPADARTSLSSATHSVRMARLSTDVYATSKLAQAASAGERFAPCVLHSRVALLLQHLARTAGLLQAHRRQVAVVPAAEPLGRPEARSARAMGGEPSLTC